jgi:ankyrin repeat protein
MEDSTTETIGARAEDAPREGEGVSSSMHTNIRTVVQLIDTHQWDEVYNEFEAHPELALEVFNPHRLGWTKLHWLCSIGSTPSLLIDLVARCNPGAILQPDTRYGDTCLHIACRNAQTSDEKVRILLRYVGDVDGVLTRNHFGGTPLHSASNHNATLRTLQLLVETNPRILKVTTREGLHAVSALWHAYLQTIPGYMSVARILQDGASSAADVDEPFERFWKKVEYLATEYYCYTADKSPRMGGPLERIHARRDDDSKYVLHSLLQTSVAINLFKVALLKCPHLARVRDTEGNLPLHRLVNDRPYRLKEREALADCLAAFPLAADEVNGSGDYPLWIAIRNKIPWENGVDLLSQANPGAVAYRVRASGLAAFQFAAAVGGKVAIESCFRLLLIHPDLIARKDQATTPRACADLVRSDHEP